MNVNKKLENALTVRELIELLRGYPDDARVVYTTDYEDRSHTAQALLVTNTEDMWNDRVQVVEESAYSTSGLALRDEQENPWDGPDVVVLS